jgi:uncharacterized protein with FMN-binding domain
MKKYLLSAAVIFAFIFYSVATTKNSSTVSTPTTITNTPSASLITAFAPANGYKNGTYTGPVADAFYGNVQVSAVIQNGKLATVNVLQSPNDRDRSIAINSRAMPILQSEAVQAQSASVDIVSGATDSSAAFISSLSSALSQAVN